MRSVLVSRTVMVTCLPPLGFVLDAGVDVLCMKPAPMISQTCTKHLDMCVVNRVPIWHRIDRTQRRVVGAAQLVQQTIDGRPLVRIVQRCRTVRPIAVHRSTGDRCASGRIARIVVHGRTVTGTAQILQQRIQLGQIAAAAGRRLDVGVMVLLLLMLLVVLLLMLLLWRLRSRQRVVRRAGSRRGAHRRVVEHRRLRLTVLLLLLGGQRLVQRLWKRCTIDYTARI